MTGRGIVSPVADRIHLTRPRDVLEPVSTRKEYIRLLRQDRVGYLEKSKIAEEIPQKK